MNKYIKKLPKEITFSQDGLNGYTYSLEGKEYSISVEDCYKGHEKYSTNKVSTLVYYVIEGKGTFKIAGELYEVQKEDVIEIPPYTEFVFAGKMKLLLIMTPPFLPENEIKGKKNDLVE